ncbi:MAG: PAS domain-containing protein [Coleofasciculaceae cyanobacterium RL_1_1]|nr:PAS domain-containing protein [Coleofasciculaceae cyanobacterium RL_1_1]
MPSFAALPDSFPLMPLDPTVVLNTPIEVAISLARSSHRSTLFVVQPRKREGERLQGKVTLSSLILAVMQDHDRMKGSIESWVKPIEQTIQVRELAEQIKDIAHLFEQFQPDSLDYLPVIAETDECVGLVKPDQILEWLMDDLNLDLDQGDRDTQPILEMANEISDGVGDGVGAPVNVSQSEPTSLHSAPIQPDRGNNLTNENGDSQENYATIIQRLEVDIADYKLLESKLHSSYMQMQVLFDVMRDVTVIVAITEDGFDVNIPSVTLFDDPLRSAVVNQAIEAFLDESEPNAFQQSVRLALQSNQTIEREHRFEVADQTLYFEALISPISSSSVLWMARDITFQKRDRLKLQDYAKRLEQSEIRFRYLLTSNPAVVYTCKADNYAWKTFVGDNIRDLLGYDPARWLNTPDFWQTRLHPEDMSHVTAWLETLRDRGHCVMEYRFLHSDGVYRWLRDELKLAIDTASGQPLEGIGSLVDITDRKRAEGEVLKTLEKERELNDLKSRFVSMASHEFRTPLAIIQSSAQLLERYELEATEKQEQFKQINTSIVHMSQLLKDVLTLGKAEAGKLEFDPEPLPIRTFCNILVPQLQTVLGQTHRIAMMIDDQIDDTTTANLDAKLLRQMLTNLLSNAIKYSPNADIVELNIALTVPNQIQFSVTDSGIGIPTNDLPRLCESFHRAANVGTIQGTGLGLAIVHRCVSLHGGTIDFNSHIECGTTVTIRLPQNLQHSLAFPNPMS